ncbi:NADH-quinone oxidoreductase subunit C [Poseidonibacter lekithochrous]|uniref:NADH-quinone oxidoreductase subunit C n=1 Tax=Poseidonibacter TaxID=2321187 RepID=UPI001C082F84|nr:MULTISPECIES: NADH-quinone oxidoreductase subunit C [Poseidonibacter]MBU3014673.1 NADH-quinone oxidoreductase subunit C [Poseidonibacter lekithochrous]MDO6827971.1 NADH-quinone oxidoreductase subunit C [Poseidonibacter sp. 1_MG-2023]
MRKYTPKDNVQRQAPFSDRFFVSPTVPRLDISSDEIFSNDYEAFSKLFKVTDAYIEHTHLVLNIDKNDIVEVMKFLSEDLEYDMLMEMSAIDYLAQKDGYELFYEMLSLSKHKRLRIKCFLNKNDAIESVTSVFNSANWSEREMYDMLGVKVINHPNMKRLIMPDDWYDYPLRKTYPLQGDEAASWYEVDKIFGKEARDVIGPEQRDPAAIDRYDTTRFARLGHEVPYQTDITEFEPETPIAYQEDDSSKIMKKLKPEESVVLKRRR